MTHYFDNKSMNEFANAIAQLDGGEFIGLAKILCVRVFKEDALDIKGKPAPRQAEEIIADCLNAYAALNRQKRREIMKIVRAAIAKEK